MNSRVTFNGGEFAPQLGVRGDLDKYDMGCSCLENWEVGQLGGITRRKGMRFVGLAKEPTSRLLPYVYSYANGENLRFLIEVSSTSVQVVNKDGEYVAAFNDGDTLVSGEGVLSFNCNPADIRYMQLNKLMILTSLHHRPMVLKFDGTVWEFEPWKFKHEPWRYTHLEPRDTEVVATFNGESWAVDFGDAEATDTAELLQKSDMLRVSYRTQYREVSQTVKELIVDNPVSIMQKVPVSAAAGDRFAVIEDDGVSYFVCFAQSGFDLGAYVEGLESPANYSNAFRPVDAAKDFDAVTPISSLKELTSCPFGTKIAFASKYYHYYTCIRDFDGEKDGFDKFKDYPDYFIEGLPVGEATPCKGKWAFKCSGTWYGGYAVRRCYDTASLTGDWELRGVSRSYNDTPANNGIEGDELEEECYLRLFITHSRQLDDTLVAGFPTDANHNMLTIDSYVHDVRLKATPIGEGEVVWQCDDIIKPPAGTRLRTKDWSWAAFSDRYGYPLLCEHYSSRLVFAATVEQPLTVWMSQTDDYDNFLESETEVGAIYATLATSSQDPICWIKPRRKQLLLGTSSMEHAIEPGSTVDGVSATNILVQVQSYQGADGQPAIAMPEKVVYVGRGGKKIFEYGYDYEADGYLAKELSVLAPHIGLEHGGLRCCTATDEPHQCVYFVTGDGQVAVCTYNSLQKVRAWHRWVTDGKVLDVCALPDGENADKLFLLVERDGTVYLEVVDDDSEYTDGVNKSDYTSTMITNDMRTALDREVRKYASVPVAVCFGQECDLLTGKVEFCSDGKTWKTAPTNDASLPKGWVDRVVTSSVNAFERKIGVRVSGNRGLEVLAVQG